MKVYLYCVLIVFIGSFILIVLLQGAAFAQELRPEDFGIYPGRVGHAGHYSNLTSGIEDLVIPSGWWWREIIFDNDLTLKIKPVSSIAQFAANGTDSGPSIVLSIKTEPEMSMFIPSGENCMFRESNSTSLIDGKNFIVSSRNCNFADHSVFYKMYSYSAPGKVVDLHLNFPTNEVNPKFLDQYIAVLDSIAPTLRLQS